MLSYEIIESRFKHHRVKRFQTIPEDLEEENE